MEGVDVDMEQIVGRNLVVVKMEFPHFGTGEGWRSGGGRAAAPHHPPQTGAPEFFFFFFFCYYNFQTSRKPRAVVAILLHARIALHTRLDLALRELHSSQINCWRTVNDRALIAATGGGEQGREPRSSGLKAKSSKERTEDVRRGIFTLLGVQQRSVPIIR